MRDTKLSLLFDHLLDNSFNVWYYTYKEDTKHETKTSIQSQWRTSRDGDKQQESPRTSGA
jgi:hypothetical protein